MACQLQAITAAQSHLKALATLPLKILCAAGVQRPQTYRRGEQRQTDRPTPRQQAYAMFKDDEGHPSFVGSKPAASGARRKRFSRPRRVLGRPAQTRKTKPGGSYLLASLASVRAPSMRPKSRSAMS
jgi:hypothetical protein